MGRRALVALSRLWIEPEDVCGECPFNSREWKTGQCADSFCRPCGGAEVSRGRERPFSVFHQRGRARSERRVGVFSFEGINQSLCFAENGKKTNMHTTRQNKTKCGVFASLALLAFASSTNAALFDFEGGVPVYDAYRSEILPATTGYHFDENLASSATVGFNWNNFYYSDWDSWSYSWDGIAVSNCDDPSISASQYWVAGDKSSYTSITGTDGSGVKGGTYGVFFGLTDGTSPTQASSDAGHIIFNELVNVQSIDIANTLVTFDQLNAQRDDDGNLKYTYCIDIYGVMSDGATLTDEYVRVTLADAEGISQTWQTGVDLSSLNVDPEGLWGLAFVAYSDWYNSYGMLAPAYCAIDNISYAAIPEPACFAAVFAAAAILVSLRFGRNKK